MKTALIKFNCPETKIAGHLVQVEPDPAFHGEVYRVYLGNHFTTVNKMFVDFDRDNYHYHAPIDKRAA